MKIIKILQILFVIVYLSESRLKRKQKSLKRRQDEALTSEQVQQQIRNRGTYYLSYTDLNERLFHNGSIVGTANSTNATADAAVPANTTAVPANTTAVPANATPATATPAAKLLRRQTPSAAPVKPAVAPAATDDNSPFGQKVKTDVIGELNLFKTHQVELPNMCKQKVKVNNTEQTKLKLDLQVSLAMNAADIVDCWSNASGSANTIVDFLNMPFLTGEQFAQFYNCSTADMKAIDISFILPNDGLKNPANLLSVVLFGDTEKTDISWLEFWVYVCNGNKPAKKNTYMAEDPKALENMILGSLEKQQAQLVAREAMMKDNAIKEKAAKIQATMLEMAKSGKKRFAKQHHTQKRKHQLKQKRNH